MSSVSYGEDNSACSFLSSTQESYRFSRTKKRKVNYYEMNLYNEDKKINTSLEKDIKAANKGDTYYAKLNLLLGIRYYNSDQKNKSYKYLDAAVSAKRLTLEDSIFAARMITARYIDEEKTDQALACSNSITKFDPEQKSYYLLSAHLLAGKKRWREASKKCTKGLKNNPDINENALVLCDVIYKNNKNYSGALSLVNQLLKIKVKDESYWVEKTFLLRALNRTDQALATLKEASILGYLTSEHTRKNLIYSEMNDGIPHEAYLDTIKYDYFKEDEKLSLLLKSKDFIKVIDLLKEKNKSLTKRQSLVLAELLFHQRRFKEASEVYQSLYKEGEDNDKLLYDLSRSYFYDKEPKKAIASFIKIKDQETYQVASWVSLIETTIDSPQEQ